MKTVIVTGAAGFIGSNLCSALEREDSLRIFAFTRETPWESLEKILPEADFIFHLAGVNRTEREEDFEEGNAGLTDKLLNSLRVSGSAIPLLLASSIQAERDNPYGNSKQIAEKLVSAYGKETGAPVFIYRLPNVFGKWCRPNYNSVVATFCHRIARQEAITVNDPSAELVLAYIDDVVSDFIARMGCTESNTACQVPITHQTTVGQLAATLEGFQDSRTRLFVPEAGSGLTRKLFATYLSYLPPDELSYPLDAKRDERGAFVELVKTLGSGQFSISTSRPGVTRGNHYHNTKNEKFIVIHGEAVIRFRDIRGKEVVEYPVSGDKPVVVDIPPGYTHNITNTGDGEMILAIWVNEPFDPGQADTWFEPVELDKTST